MNGKTESLVAMQLEAELDVVGVFPRNLQTGDKIRVVMEAPFDEELAGRLVHTFGKKFKVSMVQQISPVLPGMESEGGGTPTLPGIDGSVEVQDDTPDMQGDEDGSGEDPSV